MKDSTLRASQAMIQYHNAAAGDRRVIYLNGILDMPRRVIFYTKVYEIIQRAIIVTMPRTRDTFSHKHIGAHVAFTRSNPQQTFIDAKEIDADAIAFFLKPKLAGVVSSYPDEAVKAFNDSVYDVVPNKKYLLPHGGYTINLASDKQEIYDKSVAGLKCEIGLAEQLGVDIVLHPGFSSDKPAGIKKITKSLNKLLKNHNVKIVFETMSGKHNKSTMIGSTFEEIAALIDGIEDKSKVGVCIDTCHMFVSGYDITTMEKFDSVMRHFDNIVGRKYIRGVHINDSQKELGSGHDRHARVGHGVMGIKAFEYLMNDKHFDDIPMVLERGGEPADIKKEIHLLRSLERAGH